MTFIVLTGGDKCGKTTQCGLLASRLREYGITPYECGVPDYTSPVGKTIKAFLGTAKISAPTSDESHNLWRQAFEALHFADKMLVASDIKQAQRRGEVVVCSRWDESAQIYAEAGGFRETWPAKLCALLTSPDLRIVIDISEDTYKERLGATPDKYEANQVLQTRVRALYRQWGGPRVDGNRSEVEVAESIWKVVVSSLINQAAKPGLMEGTSFLLE